MLLLSNSTLKERVLTFCMSSSTYLMNLSTATMPLHYTGYKSHVLKASKCSLKIASLGGKLGETVFTKNEACLVGPTENLLHRRYQVESDGIII